MPINLALTTPKTVPSLSMIAPPLFPELILTSVCISFVPKSESLTPEIIPLEIL